MRSIHVQSASSHEPHSTAYQTHECRRAIAVQGPTAADHRGHQANHNAHSGNREYVHCFSLSKSNRRGNLRLRLRAIGDMHILFQLFNANCMPRQRLIAADDHQCTPLRSRIAYSLGKRFCLLSAFQLMFGGRW